jgi:hypothetical protein
VLDEWFGSFTVVGVRIEHHRDGSGHSRILRKRGTEHRIFR